MDDDGSEFLPYVYPCASFFILWAYAIRFLVEFPTRTRTKMDYFLLGMLFQILETVGSSTRTEKVAESRLFQKQTPVTGEFRTPMIHALLQMTGNLSQRETRKLHG